jgi:uncharacterized SAM-binding protein YcdF (DUF218 family)
LKFVGVTHLTKIRWLRGSFVVALLFVSFCTGAWLKRVALLRGAADLWVVSDPITSADAAVVLGGGENMRPFIAADLYSKGLVHKILVSQVEGGRQVSIGAIPSDTEINVSILRKLGVPNEAIQLFGSDNHNTWDEANALKNWTKQHGDSVFIIPTEPFFARRARWIFQRQFSGMPVQIEFPSFDPPSGYTKAEWWRTDVGVVTFQNEIVKYLYYRLKY